ncbi:hypothetical protein ABLE94_04620 [Gordonia sp. VNK1]|uniref:hypothetical protein n=1 Tax=Gordonia oleivorans TaxID=3156618 RepID=UPI0032B32A15
MTDALGEKCLFAEKVGTSLSALDFYRETGGLLIHRREYKPGEVGWVIFLEADGVTGLLTQVVDSGDAKLDEDHIAHLALSDDPQERAEGIALMRAVASGATRGTRFVLTGPDDPETEWCRFKPKGLGDFKDAGNIDNLLVVRHFYLTKGR